MTDIPGSTLPALAAVDVSGVEPSADKAVVGLDPVATTAAVCLNCGALMDGRFCAACGQGHVERITLKTFFHELAGQLLEVDRGLLHTFVELLRRPGPMIREYIKGRRRSYTSPLGYILIASAFSLLRAALTPETAQKLAEMNASMKPILSLVYSPAQIELFLRIESAITTNKFAMDAFLLVPIVLSLRFLFRKRDVNLAELAVFACYTFGQATLVTILLGLPMMLVGSATLYSAVFVTVTLSYLMYAGIGFFGAGLGTVLRLGGSVVLGLILMDGVTYLLPFVLAR
jgi:hypothetical protein